MQQTEAPPLKAWLLLLLLALIWGSSFILIKKGLIAFRPDQLAAIRIASAGFFLLPFLMQRFKTVRRHHWPKLISVGLVGSFIPAFLFAFAQTQLASGVTGVLNTFTPLATLIIGVLVFRQMVAMQQWVGVLIGLAGTFVLITASASGELQFNSFALLIIVATICYGINLNLIKHHIPDLGALTITGVSLFLVAPPALIYLLVATPFIEQLGTQPDVVFSLGAILVLGIVGTAMALVIFNTVVKMTDTTFTSSVTYLIPIVALILGVIDGEPFLIEHAIGMAAILVGVFIANRRARKPRVAPTV
ncbi:EamA family transporter [Pseudidiomarina gelatinasegens]|uniref:EamA family transporter n=1 Tax=Pseudidiomarina gelatinasegens TaxID=2487740 RepID=A0A443YZ84_9GAMM|nr:DMT family transporter [Pseudidiomarina gelatinasegens]RWU09539.1 EamA family transporter [Pseudidiomarina gelatinasegens]